MLNERLVKTTEVVAWIGYILEGVSSNLVLNRGRKFSPLDPSHDENE